MVNKKARTEREFRAYIEARGLDYITLTSEESNQHALFGHAVKFVDENRPNPSRFLDDYLPDPVIYALDDRMRMDIIERYGLKLRALGMAHAQWNGAVVPIRDSSVMLRVAGYTNREKVDGIDARDLDYCLISSD